LVGSPAQVFFVFVCTFFSTLGLRLLPAHSPYVDERLQLLPHLLRQGVARLPAHLAGHLALLQAQVLQAQAGVVLVGAVQVTLQLAHFVAQGIARGVGHVELTAVVRHRGVRRAASLFLGG